MENVYKKEENMKAQTSNSKEAKLPVPGTIYQIPTGTHADLDLQDDKERVLQSLYRRRNRMRFGHR